MLNVVTQRAIGGRRIGGRTDSSDDVSHHGKVNAHCLHRLELIRPLLYRVVVIPTRRRDKKKQ